jgi:hypothetical protein
LVIFLPPSYDNSNNNYPVVFFLPGYGDQVTDWTDGAYRNFRLPDAMDKLITAGNHSVAFTDGNLPAGIYF